MGGTRMSSQLGGTQLLQPEQMLSLFPDAALKQKDFGLLRRNSTASNHMRDTTTTDKVNQILLSNAEPRKQSAATTSRHMWQKAEIKKELLPFDQTGRNQNFAAKTLPSSVPPIEISVGRSD